MSNIIQENDDDLLSQEKDDDELTLPRASINKMIKELVNEHKNAFIP